ncbi:hypothetical protein LH462_06825 [Laribacter hongkongensis]|uniref:Uncharacterized protein n=1 Tax=Laribacter hongkongensis TaxID=168471 RepID=A0ABD4SN77_9NEIS|nr:hypothetical protein [Laribacter hongkongensis]MCG9025176.1 hypothetical protein [Laribacter hongkongensis]MCG9099764.1 hypothetical protein [Laribacter hongkongensis]MCG9103434.1 hypothetical protein [Laribacter hongkongensis]MCG9111242.1 hypothetical protein [Laribacter hongkongensis]MCG9118181.1 hypothetical protein [Laribacter hongkongensis]
MSARPPIDAGALTLAHCKRLLADKTAAAAGAKTARAGGAESSVGGPTGVIRRDGCAADRAEISHAEAETAERVGQYLEKLAARIAECQRALDVAGLESLRVEAAAGVLAMVAGECRQVADRYALQRQQRERAGIRSRLAA